MALITSICLQPSSLPSWPRWSPALSCRLRLTGCHRPYHLLPLSLSVPSRFSFSPLPILYLCDGIGRRGSVKGSFSMPALSRAVAPEVAGWCLLLLELLLCVQKEEQSVLFLHHSHRYSYTMNFDVLHKNFFHYCLKMTICSSPTPSHRRLPVLCL